MSSTPRKIAFNVVIASISKVLNTALALVGLMMITRYLGPEKFGLYITALAFSGLFNSIGDWGIYQTTTRKISRPKADEKAIIGNVMALRLAVSGSLALLIPIFIYFLPYSFELKVALILVLLGYIFYSFYQVLIGLFQKRLIMYQITLVELLGKIIQVGIVFLTIKLDLGFKFIVMGITISMATNFIIVYLLARKHLKFQLDFNTKRWKKFLKESWPIGLSVIVTFIYFRADSILLKTLRGNADVGIYGAAYKVLENITFFPGMIIGLLMPMMSYYIFKDRKKFQEIVNENFKLFIILIIPLIVIVLFLAEDIIQIIAGSEFMASATVLRIVVFALAFIFFGMLFGNILVAANLQKKQLIALIICATFNVTANLLLIPHYSYLATSYVSVATEFLVVVLSAFIVYKNLHFLPKMSKFPLVLLAGAIMSLYYFLFANLPFIFLLLSGPLLYFAILVILKVITKEEIKTLIKRN